MQRETAKEKAPKRGKASGAKATQHNVQRTAGQNATQGIEITVFAKSGGPLTKRISLTERGTILSDGSACTMASGRATRTPITSIVDFATLIETLEPNQAITLGALRDGLPNTCEVTTKDKLNGQTRPDLIARTAEALVYRPGRPSVVLLDYDAKGQPPEVAARLAALGGFWEALVTVLPALREAAHVIRASTSAGLRRTDTGERFPGSGGVHAYIVAEDGTDAVRFLEALHQRCWLHGLGWWMIDVAGRLLERSIVDRMVGQPERLVFEGAPVVVPPLTQDQASRRAHVTTGGMVNTTTACRPLTANEQAELAKLMATASQHLQPECDKVRAAYVQTRAANLAARTGCTLKEAARVIARQCAGVLLPAVELAFDDPSLTGKTVADVLANPAAFEGCTLADPIEGIAYGRTKAMVLRRRDGTVFINSFAHGGMQYELRDDSSLPAALRNMLSLADNGAGNFYSFIRAALSQTIAEDLIVEACCDQSYGGAINKHAIAKGGADYVKRQIESAANEPPTDHKGRTLIAVLKGRTDETWRATQDALIAHGCPIYVRGNRLVQPLWRWERADRERSALIARFEILNVPRLTDIVSHHAVQFQKYDGRSRKLEDIDPPKDVISQLLEARHWLFPTVVGIINAPTMREDGSLLTEQGYDPQTKLWHKSSGAVTLPPIPERPTRAEALAALAKLNELLVGFPFAKQKEEETSERCVARAVALAAVMTTALRGALPVAVPLFLITATEPRTGKTYLVHVIAMLATGHIPPSTAGASEERPDEIEKRIETAALSGRPIMHLNNLPNGMVLDSARLAELCTEGVVNIRKLGKHEEGLCDCRATTVFLNGNNIRVAGDLVPRTLLCRLNANREDPETRTFDSNPIAQVRKDRSAYLAAIFTIVRAYKAAGCPVPEGMHSVAGFEDWSSLVQQPLMWLGMADPFGEITSMRAMDPTLEELTNLLNVLCSIFKEGDKFTVAMCKKKADEQASDNRGRPYYVRQDLRDLMTFDGRLNTKSFGRLLARHLERIKDGWYYKPAGKVLGSAAYVLVRIPGQGQPQPPVQERAM